MCFTCYHIWNYIAIIYLFKRVCYSFYYQSSPIDLCVGRSRVFIRFVMNIHDLNGTLGFLSFGFVYIFISCSTASAIGMVFIADDFYSHTHTIYNICIIINSRVMSLYNSYTWFDHKSYFRVYWYTYIYINGRSLDPWWILALNNRRVTYSSIIFYYYYELKSSQCT